MIDPAKLTEYERVRRDFVRREYPDGVLKERFGLTARQADFVREYALCGNAVTAALLAGFSKKTTAKKCAARILKATSPAVDAIRNDLAAVSDGVKIALREHLTAAMLDIIDDRKDNPGPAVMACKVLVDVYQLDAFTPEKPTTDDVPEAEIEASLKRMKVLQ